LFVLGIQSIMPFFSVAQNIWRLLKISISIFNVIIFILFTVKIDINVFVDIFDNFPPVVRSLAHQYLIPFVFIVFRKDALFLIESWVGIILCLISHLFLFIRHALYWRCHDLHQNDLFIFFFHVLNFRSHNRIYLFKFYFYYIFSL